MILQPELIGRARLDDASTHVVHVGGELASWKPASSSFAVAAVAVPRLRFVLRVPLAVL
jgi:hypothetical protein